MSPTNETTACPPDFWRKLVENLDRDLAREPEEEEAEAERSPNLQQDPGARCQLPSRKWWRARRAASRHASS